MSVRSNTVWQDPAHYFVTRTTQNNVMNLFLKNLTIIAQMMLRMCVT